MRLFIIIALAVWFGIYLSKHADEFFAGVFQAAWWIVKAAWWTLTTPFRLVRWFFVEAFSKEGRARQQASHAAWLAAKSKRDAKRMVRNKVGGYIALGYFAMLALYGLSLVMGRWSWVLPVVCILGVVVAILWWNRRWKRLHGEQSETLHTRKVWE